MTKQDQIADMTALITTAKLKDGDEVCSVGDYYAVQLAEKLYNEGYRKIDGDDYVSREWHDEQVLHAESEIERLKDEKKQLNARLVKVLLSIDTLNEINIIANAEKLAKQAVKKFAKELRNRIRTYMIASGASARPWVIPADYVFSEIDYVLKEFEQ